MNNRETDISGDCPTTRLIRRNLEIDPELLGWRYHKPQSPSCGSYQPATAEKNVATGSRLRRAFVAAATMVLLKLIIRARQSFSDGGSG